MAKIKISVDDGCASDVRIAELAKKYDVVCLFYWPVEWHTLALDKGFKPLNYAEATSIAEDFDIGSHTITHRYLTQMSVDEAKLEIAESKDMLEDLFDQTINDFAPPRGYTNDLLTEFTLRFYEKQRLTKGEGLVHIHPKSGANNNKYWLDCVDEDTTEVWGHSYDWDRWDMWDEIEKFLRGLHESPPT